MTPKRIQYFIALVFFLAGGWAAFFPQHVIDTVFVPEYRQNGGLLPYLICCFGIQELLLAVFAAFSRFSSVTFLVYGVALLPFFAFNFYFIFYDPVFSNIGTLIAVSNAIMLMLCYIGWEKSKITE
ncbi:hypothetical protein [Parasphingorhabdus sp.]|uniref:hypothetical protein n=1 Tax=Parasphingorhabdus sp. TaxID=2709688 RepID=UPI0032667D56